MQIYLPIAEISVNIFLILGLGGGVGFLSGLFGVGGGFLITPLLIFYGIPPAVSVATAANQIVASSVSGVFAHWRRGNVDLKMGLVLLFGGIFGSTVGVWVFAWLRSLGQIDLVISLCYVIFLGIIGGMMLFEASRAIFRTRRKGGGIRRSKKHQHSFIHGLPFKMRFYRSGLYISALMPLLIGFCVGMLTALMGVGGGFVMVPAMIYLLGMPTGVVIGTSLFQIIFVTANVTFLQSIQTQTVDVALATLLLIGGVIGAQFGARFGSNLKAEHLRALLGLLVLSVCLKLLFDLVIEPSELYSIMPGNL
ncbi:sulfite exporter TauE/SafE family protein [Thalassospira lucentensis]|uniref:sulfite exporter TauE/SafE family protein n=1 Tax=Thalassospira lucentensis TaxID=168935 RepID=UPI00142E7355|nr:sulfite exporter TauE/SafE family protein [Thalassospira lucentensis]NIZ02507.1 sulfite exporter TauE/SafE family protein [Thalassospira lucentensis]